MQIMCPHCQTAYAIDLATLGGTGRAVRCSRCKEVWMARPEDATMVTTADPALVASGETRTAQGTPASGDPAAAEADDWGLDDDGQETEPPLVDSPPIAADASFEEDGLSPDLDEPADALALKAARPRSRPWFRRIVAPAGRPGSAVRVLPIACAGMAALAMALLIWRIDVVRLMPQTAGFYKMLGLNVNLRALVFKDIKITTETTDSKPVLVIEGVIVGEARKPIELPRLRFSVRDGQGVEIYAWNAVLEQSVLNPGERAWFKSRLASPPPEGREIEVRFFNKRDLAGGHT
jgi:predicted Zn finger-like uncharacterized protein